LTVPLVLAAAAVAAAAGAAGGQPGSGDEAARPVAVESAIPAWRDLDRARNDLELALGRRDSALMAIERAASELNRELARIDRLRDAEAGKRLLTDEVEQLVVQEYMSRGDIEDLAFVVEASDSTGALWRIALLSEVSELVEQALDAVENVPGAWERAVARLRRLNDAGPYLNSRRRDANLLVEAAEWVVRIAEINDMADRERAENGFIEPTDQNWYNLRFCESTNDYTAESANGLFYGAYQFEPRTWRTVGGTGNPAHAPPEEQDARARLLYARRGDQPWPRDYCGRWLPENQPDR